jgi:hypothetical protein
MYIQLSQPTRQISLNRVCDDSAKHVNNNPFCNCIFTIYFYIFRDVFRCIYRGVLGEPLSGIETHETTLLAYNTGFMRPGRDSKSEYPAVMAYPSSHLLSHNGGTYRPISRGFQRALLSGKAVLSCSFDTPGLSKPPRCILAH